MATWLEIRCEHRTSDAANAASRLALSGGTRCWSHDNAGPMDMARDSQRSVALVFAELCAAAAKAGWVRTREGWICPSCAARAALSPKKEDEHAD